MAHGLECALCQVVVLIFLFTVQSSDAHPTTETGVKTKVFLSPKIELEPGLVSNKFYHDVDFPRGHIALKSFDAELIDDKGNSIPLHETYLHHWALLRYHQRKGVRIAKSHGDLGFRKSHVIIVPNSGVCTQAFVEYFGLGSETRKTNSHIPDPYGIEVGNPADIPDGYEEKWMFNIHAIDTRGAEDRMGCTECRCDLYNVTIDEYGQPVPSSYVGGLTCCYDDTRCRVKEGFRDVKRSLYLRYTVKFVDWDASIVPVGIYILDVTDKWIKADASRGNKAKHLCAIEYDVEPCPASTMNGDCCIHTKTVDFDFPHGGNVIYGVGHLHAGGTGSALYGEGGKEICSSYPIYGNGHEAGDEAGYVVGMTTCYPSPGSVKIYPGERVTLLSNYSSAQKHTGVMGLFYLLIADSPAKPNGLLHVLDQVHESTMTSKIGWSVALFGIGLIFVIIFLVHRKSGKGEEYEPIMA